MKTIEFITQRETPLPVVKLQRLYLPEKSVHKHMVIAVSGFLSEKSDQAEDWASLKKAC